ncbi:MAG TPA: hypothetical protein VHI13_22405 [Candidatus Kapabacteria bacterium]|nr:hypothetical protein [Candidatus Kapabacteria bacterium]
MRTHVPPRALLSACLIPIAALAIGCGASQVSVQPDFNRSELHQPALKREGICFVKVEDRRADTSSRIGKARVGFFNKTVPYYLAGNLASNVKRMLDTLAGGSCARDRYIPVTVTIDTFTVGEHSGLFSEEAYGDFNLHFIYPITPDSLGSFSISSHPTQGAADATDEIEPLIYKGVAECARLFVERALDRTPGVAMPSDSARAANSSASATPFAQRGPVAGKDQVIAGEKQHDARNEIGGHYLTGNNIVTGVRITYGILTEKDSSDFRWGAGLSFNYSDIRNQSASLTGTFVNFGSRVMGRYFLGTHTSFYLAGAVGLVGGTESIDYGTNVESSFFIGPNVEETIGLTLNRKLFLEVGSYQLAYFGSKLLPSDVGLIAGVSIGL